MEKVKCGYAGSGNVCWHGKDCYKQKNNRSLRTFLKDNDITIDQLQELVEKKQKGLLVELPCKVGDRVWLLLEKDTGTHDIYESWLWYVKIPFKAPVSYSCVFKCNEIGNSLEYRLEDFGKTVFLTEEAALAALEVTHET